MFEMRTVGASPTFAARKQPFDFSVEAIPPGFKVVRLEFGKVFYCEVCNQPVNTRQSCPRCDGAGQPLSRDRKLIPGADAVCVAEGNMTASRGNG